MRGYTKSIFTGNEILIMNDSSVKGVSLRKKFFSLKTLISFSAAFIILYFLYTRIDTHKTIRILEKTNWFLYFMAFVVFYFTVPIRGIRWRMILTNAGFRASRKDATEILFISWFTNCVIPAKLGDLYRAYLVKKNYDFSLSKTMGSIFVERVSDMLILFVLFGFAGLLSFRSKLPPKILSLFGAGFSIVVIFVLVLLSMRYFDRFIRKILPGKIEDIYGRFEEGTINSIKRVPLLACFTLLIWLLEIGRLFFVTHSLHLEVRLSLITFVALASALLTAIPISPAGLGAVEFAIMGILLFFNFDKEVAFSVAILDRVISYWSIIVFGFVLFVFSRKTSRVI